MPDNSHGRNGRIIIAAAVVVVAVVVTVVLLVGSSSTSSSTELSVLESQPQATVPEE
jgi:negative regulator of sigma E activity